MLRADPGRRYTIGGSALTREEVIHRYFYLVKYAAGRISVNLPSSVDINDLISDGVFGLIDAIEKYDGARSVKFETYAMTRINGAIFDALRTLDWVPRTVRQQARQVERAHDRLEVELGRAPNDVELASRLDLSVGELDRLMQRVRGTSVVSLEEPLPNSGDQELYVRDTIEDAESDVTTEVERHELRRELVRAVETLPPHEQTVIRRYYFEGRTLREIKTALSVSESRVSQIHAQAVVHLRQFLKQD
ncbi:MAG TPA: FliA/WhiG family RNA polymerase sigma factor [Candidatus Baltobacteraceae bacterium]|jgi:RNA polymerase sigma factor for flagellar operon FliA|nr:FliA/WhiG family RNA polymerase sigma factor [Candidatus Baltobacteraceae bacterium]